ncbi:MAG: hypothetical protein P4L60_19865 [Clostridium sp.]|nr:hypothetical protein [Clostridium sp.]
MNLFRHMKENSKSKMLCVDVNMKSAYFSSGKEVDCPHSGSLKAI